MTGDAPDWPAVSSGIKKQWRTGRKFPGAPFGCLVFLFCLLAMPHGLGVALPLFFQYHIFFAQQAGQLLQQDGLRINPPALRRPYHTAGIGKADVYRQRPLKYP